MYVLVWAGFESSPAHRVLKTNKLAFGECPDFFERLASSIVHSSTIRTDLSRGLLIKKSNIICLRIIITYYSPPFSTEVK